MNERELILKLARVIIAIAWTDGNISNDEINCLKDLLFTLRKSGFDDVLQINAQDWARLEMYIESPVGEEERARLVVDLQNSLRTSEDKRTVINALNNMVRADGIVSEEEKENLLEVQQAIESVEVGAVGGLQRLLGSAMQHRLKTVENAPNREVYFEDFIKNKVYYSVSQRLAVEGKRLEISDEEFRILSLVGGLMAKVAYQDREVGEDEFQQMVAIIENNWGLSLEESAFVAEIAINALDVTYDTFRMIRELTTSTAAEERKKVLDVLFAVAVADGDISFDEMEEIRLIARGLELSHRDFIDAKLRILGEERPF